MTSIVPPNNKNVIVKFDSAASSHYVRPVDAHILDEVEEHEGTPVTLPDDTVIAPSHQGILPLSAALSKEAKTATVLPQLQSSTLLSMGKICDDDNLVVFNKQKVRAFAASKEVEKLLDKQPILLEGRRNPVDGLWDTSLTADVSRFKDKLQDDVFVMPATHPNIYRDRKINNDRIRTQPSVAKKIVTKQLQHNDEFDQILEAQRLKDINEHHRVHLRNNNINIIIKKDKTKQELANFLYVACFSPVLSTFIKAIDNGHFNTWPGLSRNLMKKHLPPSIASAKGHLNQERQGIQSTKHEKSNYSEYISRIKANIARLKQQIPSGKTLEEALREDVFDDAFPISEKANVRTNDVVYAIIDHKANLAYMDLTGRFPYKSSRGNEYILVAYHFDANAILVDALKNREAKTITEAWENINNRIKKGGLQPNTYILDNECSNMLRDAFHKNEINYQLDKPHMHRANAAERAIQTFKAHLKAGLASVDPDFPVREWDRLLPQAEMTLNMLRSSRINPKLSAYALLFGEFDYNKTPLVPPGTKVLAHKKPDDRASWAFNGEEGWSIGPAMQHYRCIKCYFPITKSERNVDTVTFFPKSIPFPKVSADDFLKQAATDIINILSHPPSTTTLSLQIGDETRNGLVKVAKALNRVEKIPENKTLLPRVDDKVVQVPRVRFQKSVEVKERSTTTDKHPTNKALEQNMLKKKIFRRSPKNHSYNLRNRTLPRRPMQPLAQHLSHNKCVNFKTLAACFLKQQEYITQRINHIYNNKGKKQTIDALINGPDATTKWLPALSNEWGRLAQGNDTGVEATDTIQFVAFSDVPIDKKVTYASFVCDYRPLKKEKWRVRLVVGGDKLEYTQDSGSPATDLTETKILLNSTISEYDTKGSQFLSMDLKDMFLHTPMKDPEYMKIPFKYFPQDIVQRYKLDKLKHINGYVYVKITKGMYGLKQAAVLAYNNLSKLLLKAGYFPLVNSQGMWKHISKPTTFCLCVDDFGVKYCNKEDVQHLIDAISTQYTCTIDWTGRNFLGLTLDWNYAEGYVDISMPDYVNNALERLQYKQKVYPQYSPHKHEVIQYSKQPDRQYAMQEDSSPLLLPDKIKYVQSIIGTFLYYARAIDGTMLPAIAQIAQQQAQPTQKTLEKCQQLMDYANTYRKASIRYYKSDMVLEVDSDASYLVLPKARSRYAGYYRFLQHKDTPQRRVHNGAILIECKTIRHVVTSAAEAETKGVFQNAKTVVALRNLLQQIGHPQPPTRINTDNSTTVGFVKNNIQMKRSKSWDMNFHWLRDKETLKEIDIAWGKGTENYADYFTKHHSLVHHRKMRSIYIRDIITDLYSKIKQVKK